MTELKQTRRLCKDQSQESRHHQTQHLRAVHVMKENMVVSPLTAAPLKHIPASM